MQVYETRKLLLASTAYTYISSSLLYQADKYQALLRHYT
jgi:hypothetical protein